MTSHQKENAMPQWRVERTEFHTRVFHVEAATEEEALDTYFDEEEDEEHSFHGGQPDVRIERIEIDGTTTPPPPRDTRWARASAALQSEQPWCGWTMAFAHGSDWDTTEFGLGRLLNINVLLTTADGRSRPMNIRDWQMIQSDGVAGIAVRELNTKDYEPLDPSTLEFVRYEDIREIVVY